MTENPKEIRQRELDATDVVALPSNDETLDRHGGNEGALESNVVENVEES